MKKKFKKGDKIYLHKRGLFGDEREDWTLEEPILVKNQIYTVAGTTGHSVQVVEYGYIIHEDHFKKYEV